MNFHPKLFIALLPIVMAFACSEANFSGTASKNKGTHDLNEGQANPQLPERVDEEIPEKALIDNDCEVTGDKVTLNFSPTIKSCYEDSKVFNFAHNPRECSKVEFSKNYQCNWAAVKEAVKKLSPSQAAALDSIAAEAKLLACGETNGGNTIIIQWWLAGEEQTQCKHVPGKSQLGTVCFEKGQSADANIGSQALVDNCFNR